MVDFKRVNAEDNPDHEKVEADRREERNAQRRKTGESHPELSQAQTDRDSAEKSRQQGVQGAAATRDNDRDAVDQSAKLGGGPAGLNKGPSDTVSADPHNPRSDAPLYGTDQTQRDQGMGRSPPQGAAVTSDKPNLRNPIEDRARQQGTDEAKEAAEKAREEARAAEEQRKNALGERSDAEKRIAENQAPPTPGQQGGHGFGAGIQGQSSVNPDGSPKYSGSGESESPAQREAREKRERENKQGQNQF